MSIYNNSSRVFLFFFLLTPPPLTSTLFPYTTLFRSDRGAANFRQSQVAIAAHIIRYFERGDRQVDKSEEHTSELQSQFHLVCRLLLEKKKKNIYTAIHLSTN